MQTDHTSNNIGTAAAGVFASRHRPPVPEVPPSLLADIASQEFSLESYETFLNRDEQAFCDWGIGMLEDAGVVGVLKNKTVYLGNSLQGEIDTGVGPAYVVSLTNRSVEFSFGRSETFPIGFESVVLEAGLDRIEASQVRRAFDSIRRNSAYLRAWR